LEPIDALDIVELLSALVDKSLVITDRADGTTRYRLLETLRQYGEERLEERDETLLARDRHLAHYVGAARRGYELWLSKRYEDGAAVFGREWDNFRVAHATALATGDLVRAEAVLDATYAFGLHDQRSEFLDWTQWTLSAANAAGRHTAATYGQAASFLFRLGNFDEALESATKGLGISPLEPRGALLCLTYILAVLGAQHRSGERQAATMRLDALLAPGGDPFVTAVAVTIAATTGADSARGHLDLLEDLAGATAAPPLQELAGLSRGMFLLNQTPPDPEGALAAFRHGVDASRRTASGPIAASNLYGLAICSVLLGLSTAVDACRDAVTQGYDSRHWGVVWGSVGAAMVQLAMSGELEPATVIYGHLEAHWPPRARDHLRAEDIERLLADPNADCWRAQGAAMDRHEVIRYALECLGPRPKASPAAPTDGPGTASTAHSPG
jgi:hypothetical protein